MSMALMKLPEFSAPVTPYQHPSLQLVEFPGKGRGVVASAPIAAGETLEIAGILPLTPDEAKALGSTIIDNYVFRWHEKEDPQSPVKVDDFAVILGVTSLLNHRADSNADFEKDFTTNTVRLSARRDIAAFEEITIDYDCELWFEVKE